MNIRAFAPVKLGSKLHIYPLGRIVVGHANSVGNSPGIGTAVTDHTGPLDAEQWGTAVLSIIDLLPEGAKGGTGKEVADLGEKPTADLLAKHAENGIGQPFGNLKLV